MKMRVFASKSRYAPIVIETNLDWAIPYWTARKRTNPNIFWEFA